ncbi:hypothetical protein OT109_17740 [Phycisphaeraceae bacterium D3-23]
MNVDTFLRHHGITDNPFTAEEARLDPIFGRLAGGTTDHPDFPKILGQIDQPATAVVFGEKGSGKTAIRLMLGRKINEHNNASGKPVLVVAYDDLNPVLDKLLQHKRQDTAAMLKGFRLEDHQDAILARAMTKMVSAIIEDTSAKNEHDEPVPHLDTSAKAMRSLSKQTRIDLAILAALYDEPRSGPALPRFRKLKRKLRIGQRIALWFVSTLAIVFTVAAAALWGAEAIMDDPPSWMVPAIITGAGLAILFMAYAAWRWLSIWGKAFAVRKEMPAVSRSSADLRAMLELLRPSHLGGQPLPRPTKGNDLSDTRYQLTRRFVSALKEMGFAGMVIFIDRMDEPTLVHGDIDRMKQITWPMFDNKFLKQDGVGLKLLLPLELRYELGRESATFFQEARLDKQNMVDRLTWSGATLYDLCSQRLQACADPDREPKPTLASLFEDSVTPTMLIDALDQMHQPRDAFKFLYAVIQEHCKLVPEDQGDYDIARLTLETVRRDQAQRVQELYRGRAPA